jgi:hypothetical protein
MVGINEIASRISHVRKQQVTRAGTPTMLTTVTFYAIEDKMPIYDQRPPLSRFQGGRSIMLTLDSPPPPPPNVTRAREPERATIVPPSGTGTRSDTPSTTPIQAEVKNTETSPGVGLPGGTTNPPPRAPPDEAQHVTREVSKLHNRAGRPQTPSATTPNRVVQALPSRHPPDSSNPATPTKRGCTELRPAQSPTYADIAMGGTTPPPTYE